MLVRSAVRQNEREERKRFLLDVQKELSASLAVQRAFLRNDSRVMSRLKESSLPLHKKHALAKLASVKDPLDAQRDVALLLLIETLYGLQRRTIPLTRITRDRDAWISIADHFGFWRLRYLLEDKIFETTDPQQYGLVSSLLEKQNCTHMELFENIRSILRVSLKREGVRQATIDCRKKNTYGVYQKIRQHGRSINHIVDVFGFRVITESVNDCYTVLQVLHRLWRPFPGRLKDYIASPKPNGYQSLHTTLHCLDHTVVEFQIRTKAMERIAKFGPAGHAAYKAANRNQRVARRRRA